MGGLSTKSWRAARPAIRIKMLTNGQKKALHCAARQAGLDRDAYKLVIRNVGGFQSAADKTASREGFIAAMAFFEARSGGRLRGNTPGYWAAENDRANPRDPVIYRLRQLADSLGMDRRSLDDFLAGPHCSSGLYRSLDEAPVRSLVKLLEGLKAISHRRHQRNPAAPGGGRNAKESVS